MLQANLSSWIVPLCSLTVLGGVTAPASGALYAFATQQTTTYSVTNAIAGDPTIVSSTGAAQSVNPMGSEAQNGALDALQSYVGPAHGRPGENFFGRKGMTTPNYARADSLFTQSPVMPRNVAELYLTEAGSATASGTSMLSVPLQLAAAGPVSIAINFSNFFAVDHPGTVSGTVRATHAFEVTVEDSAGASVYAAAPNAVNRTTLYHDFNSSLESLSGQITFTTGGLPAGAYTARFVSTESVSAEIVPEPAFGGAACVAALLLWRRKR